MSDIGRAKIFAIDEATPTTYFASARVSLTLYRELPPEPLKAQDQNATPYL